MEVEHREQISIDDFAKVQLQIGVVLECEEVKKSKKLLCSKVQIGNEVRQIVSGIKLHYSAADMVGRKVVVVTNLKPAVIAGIESQGMLLCAEDEKGNLSLLTSDKEMPSGAPIA
jgi:methionyl-tRNA synthetase